MTREEAAEILDPETSRDALWKYEGEEQQLEACNEACRIGANALRAQQNPAKLDGSRWKGCGWCRRFQGKFDETKADRYCKLCGRPLTEEAWAELERRINGGTTD